MFQVIIKYALIFLIASVSFLLGRLTYNRKVHENLIQESKIIKLVDVLGDSIDWNSPVPKQITLAKILEEMDYNLENLEQIEFIGDESSNTKGKCTILEIKKDKDELEWLWNRVFSYAEPYSLWFPSGYRLVKLYFNNKNPVQMYVNESDATNIAGVKGRFMCHGFEKYILSKLKNENEDESSKP